MHSEVFKIPLSVWQSGPDWVIASSKKEVLDILLNIYGSREDIELNEPQKYTKDILTITFDDPEDAHPLPPNYTATTNSLELNPVSHKWDIKGSVKVRAKVKDWLKVYSFPCHLCSSEY